MSTKAYTIPLAQKTRPADFRPALALGLIILGLLSIGSCAAQGSSGSDLPYRLGYTDLKPLVDLGGLWEGQATETRPTLALIDVRTAAEFASGHIPGAINIPVDQIARVADLLPADTHIVLYCRSGNRSGQAGRALKELGFTRLQDLGPVSAWKGQLAY